MRESLHDTLLRCHAPDSVNDMSRPQRIRAGHYRIGEVEIVRIAGRAWITRSAYEPRQTYDWYDSLRDAVAAFDGGTKSA